jgi:NTE family protein
MIGPQKILDKIKKYETKSKASINTPKENLYKTKMNRYMTILQKGGAYVQQSKLKKYLYTLDGDVINNGEEYAITIIHSNDTREMYYFGKVLEEGFVIKNLSANSLNNSISSNFFSGIINKVFEKTTKNLSKEINISPIEKGLMYYLSQYASVNNPIQHSYTFLYNELTNIMSNYHRKTSILNKINTFNYEKIRTKNPNPYNIEHITFTGGGAKGIIYVGTLLALLVSGLIVYVNKITGTSAGAMTACVCGCVTPKREIYEKMKTMNLISIDSEFSTIIQRYYACVSYVTNKLYNADMEELMGKLHIFNAKSTIENVRTVGALFNPDTKFVPWYIDMCKTICKIMDNDLIKYITDDKLFTFDEYSKATGKSLVIVATNVNEQTTMYFSSKNSPDINVIDAIKASMAIPIAFPPQLIKTEDIKVVDGIIYDKTEIISKYIDGGVYDNYALNNSDLRDRNGNIIKNDSKQLGFFLTTNKTPYELYRELANLYVNINDTITNTAIITQKNSVAIIAESGILETRNKIKSKYIGREYLHDTKTKVDKICEKIILETKAKGKTDIEKKVIAAQKKIHKVIADLLKQKIYYPKIHVPESAKLSEEEVATKRKEFLKYYLGEELRDEKDYDVFDHISYCYSNEYVESELNLFHVNIKELYDITHECIVSLQCDNVETYANILNDIISLRNPIYIIFKECWKSVGYSENSNNNYFGYPVSQNDTYRYYATYALTIKHLSDLMDEAVKGLSYINNVLKSYTLKFTTQDVIKLSVNITRGIVSTIQKINEKRTSLKSLILGTTLSDQDFVEMLKFDYIDVAANFFKKATIDNVMAIYTTAADTTKIADGLLTRFNDKSAISVRNRLRTVSLNTFDVGTLEFSMSNERKGMMIYEGYQKTIKHLSQILCLQDLTNKSISDGTMLDSQTFK